MGKSRRSGQNPLYRSRPDAVAESRGRPSGREPARVRAERAEAICRRLADLYPDSRCSLDFRSPFELLIATILSAQCTDKRVNLVTPVLFARWPDPVRMAAADGDQLEEVIHSTGFFRSKARNIRGCCQRLVDRHGGQVPETLAELVALPGVGRKTANVVLGSGMGRAEGVVVDTHVGRLSRRLGLTRNTDAVRAERDLMAVVPRPHWVDLSHRLIEHGRGVCAARKPRCGACPIEDLCPRVGLPRTPGKNGGR
jgi:endonuclease-3